MANETGTNVATQLFNIPELLELILLSLFSDPKSREIGILPVIHLSRTTTRTWHALLSTSTPLRRRLYLATPFDATDFDSYNHKLGQYPARANPWIHLVLFKQRHWGCVHPFDLSESIYDLEPSEPRHWTFRFEMTRAQYLRLPPPGSWREMLASSPPFTDFWYTRTSYELRSGRTSWLTYPDYDAKLSLTQQRCRVHCDSGVTLGMLVDAVCELMEKHPDAMAMMIESLQGGEKGAVAQARFLADRPAPTS